MKVRIKDRIRQNYVTRMQYHTLMQLVFPERDYPKAWRYSHNGGPPGCAMAFNRALREMGGNRDTETGIVWIPNVKQID